MGAKVLLTKQAYEKLVRDFVNMEEQKRDLIDGYFADPSPERTRFSKLIEQYISQVDELIKNIRVDNTGDNRIPFVIVGSEVTLQDLDSQETLKLRIVPPLQNTESFDASCLSPVGMALLLKKVDEEATVETPAGVFRYKVLTVTLPFP